MNRRVTAVAFLLFLLLVGVACKEKKEQTTQKARLVKVIHAGTSRTDDAYTFTFISEPSKKTRLSFRVNGPLMKMSAEAGTYFKKGELIAQIDPRNFIVNEDKAEANFKQSEAEYNRLNGLYEKNNIPKSSYEKSYAKYLNAKADLSTAKNALLDTRLLAPFDGYIQEKFVERAQDVRASEPVVEFIDLKSLHLVASITEDVARQIKEIKSISVIFDAYPEHEIPVVLKDIAKSSSKSNFSYKMTTQLLNNNSNLKLLGGMTGKIRIHMSTHESTIALPIQAICNDQINKTHVWLVGKDGVLEIRQVKIGELRGDNLVQIDSGLKGNETVVLAGQPLLRNAEVVRTKN